MRSHWMLLVVLLVALMPLAFGQECVACHNKVTPKIVSDWEISAHSDNAIGCSICHGAEHTGTEDVAKVKLPTPQVCAGCHDEQVTQFSAGKHALGWASFRAMPTTHQLPMAMVEGQKGCAGCHKIGLKSDEEMRALKKGGAGFGVASCDACHTRHTFSLKEARAPQACQSCHMGFDHPQWEMYSSSKHGVRALLKQNGTLPEGTAAPTCQSCHMPAGNHEVRTAWGFLAVRLPLPEDPQWKADQFTILQALGVLDPEGKPTGRLDVVKAADVARLDQTSFDKERAKMLAVCSECHSENYAKQQFAAGDEMIKQADHLLAEAIRVIAGLYKDGVIDKPESYTYAFPDLLTFHDAPREIEQRLFEMHLKHRMRAFQGAFHMNPDYTNWYGWSEMLRDLTAIKEQAAELRAKKVTAK